LRYPNATELESQKTDDSRLSTVDSHSWQTNEGGVRIELKGTRVVILEGVPRGADSDQLLAALK
jgi:hypothetical protein